MLVAFKQSIKALRSNPGRTVLTTLGIIIGIATVIIVLSAGEGFRSYINSQVDAFGSSTVFAHTKVPPTTRARNAGSNGGGVANNPAAQAVQITTLKPGDITEIKRLANVADAYGAVLGQKVASYKNVSKNAFIFGSSAARFNIDKGVIKQGRPFTTAEDLAADQVAILGNDIAADFFGQEDPIGKSIRVGEYNFQVIGVYDRRGSFGFSNDDQQVFIPLTTAQKKLLGIDHLLYIVAQVKDQTAADATAADMAAILRKNHNISNPDKDDFEAHTQAQSLDTFATILAGVTFLLIAIAGISLLVGGVGIMNIMYVIVTERTSEIGLKKALGAKQRDILAEFLLEAVLLTILGGILGIALGSLISWSLAQVAQNFGFAWKFIIPVSGIVIGLSVAGGIGLIFGVFPARRAAKLDPVEALRYE